MVRRSLRLESTGYYNSNGVPIVSYQETRVRKSVSRRLGDTESTESSSENIVTYSSWNEDSMSYTLKHFCLSVLFISLFLVFTCLLYERDIKRQVSSPTIIGMVSGPGCHDTHLKELEKELRRLKNTLDYLLPSADLLPNFALKSLGAKVLHWMSSDTYQDQQQACKWFRFPFGKPAVSPNIVIQGESRMLPGQCWAFSGSKGHLSIALFQKVNIDQVTLGHLPKILSQTGTISSAPKEFSVYGKKDLEDEGTLLGTFLYDEDGNQLQTFNIPNHRRAAFSYVKLQVHSNWGHPEYTCLYSFRVHGKVEP